MLGFVKKYFRIVKQYKYYWIAIFAIFNLWFWFFSLPNPLFKTSNSTVIYSQEGNLLGAKIAQDGQWRFPPNDSVPYRFQQAIVQFEDAYFYKHFGVNPISLFRAMRANIKAKKIVRGGSTISMQTIRLAKQNPKRTFWEKFIEMLQAIRLEFAYSKESILLHYASNAPFGGNVVGLDAAAWRYYQKLPHQLSWGESATLAVLPNAPSLIYPGKNQNKLLSKRNKLLQKLYKESLLSQEDYQLALLEPLPNKPNALPQFTPHLLAFANKTKNGNRIKSSIDFGMQEITKETVNKHHKHLQAKEIHNIAVLVVEVESGQIKSYIGNTNSKNQDHNNWVDVIQSPRSSGSILKPFLYHAMLSEGQLLPKMLLNDTPSDITENYDKQYSGAVAADEALAKSLNIPALDMLKRFGVEKFYDLLQEFGFETINRLPSNYGLSLIVGGAEIKLWDLAQAYRHLAHQIQFPNQKQYNPSIHFDLNLPKIKRSVVPKSNPAAAYLTAKAMQKVVRPTEESGWQLFSQNKIAWKTGTSHGFRDAWAVGMSANYVVAVWCGNADGEGRPGIIGVKAAAPILFDVFNRIENQSATFNQPKNGFVQLKTCDKSGYLFGPNCEDSLLIRAPYLGKNAKVCPHHKKIHLNLERTHRVNSNCYNLSQSWQENRFVLPTLQAFYFKRKHPWYKELEDFANDCLEGNKHNFVFIYPKNFNRIYLPKDASGQHQSVVFEIAHRKPSNQLFWYLDNDYVGTTQHNHQMALAPDKGKHNLLVVDSFGKRLQKEFYISR